jgi:peptide/nickel transport system permease protein
VYQHVAIDSVELENEAPRHLRWASAVLGVVVVVTHSRKALAGGLILLGFAAMALFAPWIAPYDPNATGFATQAPPSASHLLGTTLYGQDVFSQLIWSARESLLIGLAGGLAATIISALIGVTAAYRAGLTDHILSLFTDIFLVLPALPLMIVIASYYPRSGPWVIIAVIVLTGWAFGARLLRSQALSLRNREYLRVARVRGESSAYIILFELLPNMTSLLVASFLGAALYSVLAAAGLQFLGLGNIEDLSWGTMLYWAQNAEALVTGSPLWGLAPGVCIALLGASFALLNYAFDEVANPALKTARRSRGRVRS